MMLEYGIEFEGPTVPFDTTNPKARNYLWNVVKKTIMKKESTFFG